MTYYVFSGTLNPTPTSTPSNLQRLRLGEERKKKKEEQTTGWKYIWPALFHRAAIITVNHHDGWLEFNAPFQHKQSYVRDDSITMNISNVFSGLAICFLDDEITGNYRENKSIRKHTELTGTVVFPASKAANALRYTWRSFSAWLVYFCKTTPVF